jgi:hypothetical protein
VTISLISYYTGSTIILFSEIQSQISYMSEVTILLVGIGLFTPTILSFVAVYYLSHNLFRNKYSFSQ